MRLRVQNRADVLLSLSGAKWLYKMYDVQRKATQVFEWADDRNEASHGGREHDKRA